MLRLTREVRFAINAVPDGQPGSRPSNAYGGFPSINGLAHYFTLRVTLTGALDRESQYVRNIKEIDDAVRKLGIPLVERHVRERSFGGGGIVVGELLTALAAAWPGAAVEELSLHLSPFTAWAVRSNEFSPEKPMVRFSQKFEFSATHRLHNPELSADANRQTFGKCNNPHGHGHNYEVQVTLVGVPDENGTLADIVSFERTVAEAAIDRLDHKNLNVEVPEFRQTIPSVENIAKVIFGMLKPVLADGKGKLASVTVWETPKTWAEYGE